VERAVDTGAIGMTPLTAWIAKERPRDLLARAAPAPTGTGWGTRGGSPWCADCEIPKARRLAAPSTAGGPRSRRSSPPVTGNAKSEGVNRVIKLTARAAHGLRNPANQRLRTRRITTRRARGHLRTAQL
jgi:hypothetical protein